MYCLPVIFIGFALSILKSGIFPPGNKIKGRKREVARKYFLFPGVIGMRANIGSSEITVRKGFRGVTLLRKRVAGNVT